MNQVSVGLVEDDRIIREGLIASIDNSPGLSVAIASPSIELFLEEVSKNSITELHVLLLDIGLPGMNGINGIPFIRKQLPNTDIIMLTAYDDTEQIFKALCAGACSYISKKTSLKVILDAVHTVSRGGSYMSPSIARKIAQQLSANVKKTSSNHEQISDRQLELIEYLSQGLSYKMVGDKMNISLNTVRSHIRNIYSVLEVNSKIEVINLYRDGELS